MPLSFPQIKALAISALGLLGLTSLGYAAQTAIVSPNMAQASYGFTVTVTGKTNLCSPIFSHKDTRVDNGSINLSAAAAGNPLANCTPGEKDYSVEFDIPSLKAGSYSVTISLLPECFFSAPPCQLLKLPLDSAGILIIQDSTSFQFSNQPKTVASGMIFDLFLAGKSLSCSDSFSNKSVSVEGNILYLDFMKKSNPTGICPRILMDYGPTFTVPAMRAGTYQVFATMNPYCAPNSPCPLMMAAPSLAGALVVSKSTTKIVRGSPNLNTISKPNFLTPGFKTSSKTNAQSQWVAPNGRTLKVKRND